LTTSTQLDLDFPATHRATELWPQLLDRIRAVCSTVGRKEISWELSVDRKYLDNLLAERDGRQLRGEQLLFFLAREPELLVWLASALGYELRKRRSLSDGEKLAALRAAVRGMGAVGDQLLQIAGVDD
jgi:hypothetical protein